jgi:hypothetical protein
VVSPDAPTFRAVDPRRVLSGSGAVDVGLTLAGVGVVKTELIGAVVAHGHGHMPEVNHLDLVRVTAF